MDEMVAQRISEDEAEMTRLFTCDKCGKSSPNMDEFDRTYVPEAFDVCEPCGKRLKIIKDKAVKDWLGR